MAKKTTNATTEETKVTVAEETVEETVKAEPVIEDVHVPVIIAKSNTPLRTRPSLGAKYIAGSMIIGKAYRIKDTFKTKIFGDFYVLENGYYVTKNGDYILN